jgi:hypothetical protein
MGRTPRGTVSGRQRQKAIRLLSEVVDDESAAVYLRVQAARSLLSQKNQDDDEDDDIHGHTPARVVILPSNGREQIVGERYRPKGDDVEGE